MLSNKENVCWVTPSLIQPVPVSGRNIIPLSVSSGRPAFSSGNLSPVPFVSLAFPGFFSSVFTVLTLLWSGIQFAS